MQKQSLIPLALIAVVAALASSAAYAGSGTVQITMGPVVVDTSVAGQATVSVDVTNAGTAQIRVDLNVISLGDCTGDVFACDAYDCERGGVAGVNRVRLDAGDTTTLTVVIPLAAGDYLFRARVTGYKGGNEDQKFGVKPATVL